MRSTTPGPRSSRTKRARPPSSSSRSARRRAPAATFTVSLTKKNGPPAPPPSAGPFPSCSGAPHFPVTGPLSVTGLVRYDATAHVRRVRRVHGVEAGDAEGRDLDDHRRPEPVRSRHGPARLVLAVLRQRELQLRKRPTSSPAARSMRPARARRRCKWSDRCTIAGGSGGPVPDGRSPGRRHHDGRQLHRHRRAEPHAGDELRKQKAVYVGRFQ